MDDALLDLEGAGNPEERGGLSEVGVLSWRIWMKRFGVRGLSAAFHKYACKCRSPFETALWASSGRTAFGSLEGDVSIIMNQST